MYTHKLFSVALFNLLNDDLYSVFYSSAWIKMRYLLCSNLLNYHFSHTIYTYCHPLARKVNSTLYN